MAGKAEGKSSSPEKVPRGAWETSQILISALIAHALSFQATGLDGFARRQPTVTPMGAVTPPTLPLDRCYKRTPPQPSFFFMKFLPNFPQI